MYCVPAGTMVGWLGWLGLKQVEKEEKGRTKSFSFPFFLFFFSLVAEGIFEQAGENSFHFRCKEKGKNKY